MMIDIDAVRQIINHELNADDNLSRNILCNVLAKLDEHERREVDVWAPMREYMDEKNNSCHALVSEDMYSDEPFVIGMADAILIEEEWDYDGDYPPCCGG